MPQADRQNRCFRRLRRPIPAVREKALALREWNMSQTPLIIVTRIQELSKSGVVLKSLAG